MLRKNSWLRWRRGRELAVVTFLTGRWVIPETGSGIGGRAGVQACRLVWWAPVNDEPSPPCYPSMATEYVRTDLTYS